MAYLDYDGLSYYKEKYDNQVKNIIADEYDSTATYAVGDLSMHENKLYKCNTAITTAEQWTAAHWTLTDVDTELTDKVAVASMAQNYDPTATYSIGDYCWQAGQLYRCTVAIDTPEAWNIEHWTAVQLADEVGDLKDALNVLDASVLHTDEITGTTFKEQMIGLANLGIPRRYGFRREKANSDCADRITYLYDAIGLQPAGMTFDEETGEGTWNYGDWQNFVEAIARPVMLKQDGTVDYELDHDDQTLQIDGVTASDVANVSYAGNAMVEFSEAFKWVKRYEDDDYEYVIFCNIQYDSGYHAYAHTANDGSVKDAFYIGMFNGPDVSGTKLRSIGNDRALLEIINEELSMFFAGSRSAEETAQIIDSRASIYVSENS